MLQTSKSCRKSAIRLTKAISKRALKYDKKAAKAFHNITDELIGTTLALHEEGVAAGFKKIKTMEMKDWSCRDTAGWFIQ